MAVVTYDRPTRSSPAFSAPAIVAVICAVASFFFGAGLGLLLAIIAIVAGAIGVIMALSPSVRGGIASIISIVAGVVGILAAIVKLVV
jgi:uncharacterized membrane protein HdeD (DUF308 family)